VIRVRRGPEPAALRTVRAVELPKLAKLAKEGRLRGEDITGYRVVAPDLWRAHHFKCCYCELKITLTYNDVEHHRPKGSATRHPGSTATHGYWWLAFTWINLLYACPPCNRSNKNDLFPLAVGSIALAPGGRPPGKEKPLLLDPARENGVEHIEFVFTVVRFRAPGRPMKGGWHVRKHWRPRGRTEKGDHTIRICGLDTIDLVELYDDHVEKVVRPAANDLKKAIKRRKDVREAFDRAMRLLDPRMPFVGLSYDALRALVPSIKLAEANLAWPEPHQVGRLTGGSNQMRHRPPRRGT
jgi:hypothetical protein